MEVFCSVLCILVIDSNKYCVKVDCWCQCFIFCVVLYFVEGGECEEEIVCFGFEVFYMDSWVWYWIYIVFKEVLGLGMYYYFQNNELFCDIFGLGFVLVLDVIVLKVCKVLCFEKYLYNVVVFKVWIKV